MQLLHVCCVCYVLGGSIMMTDGQSPTWITPNPSDPTALVFSLEPDTVCQNRITKVEATPGDMTPVFYSVEKFANLFEVVLNGLSNEYELQCAVPSISEGSYEVDIRAKQSLGNEAFSDLTLMINVGGSSVDCGEPENVTGATITKTNGNLEDSYAVYACEDGTMHTLTCNSSGIWDGETPACSTGPIWTTAELHLLNLYDGNACDQVTTLTADSTDGSSVLYGIYLPSPFDINVDGSGANLTCNQSALTLTTYQVVVSATNSGDRLSTNLTLSIEVKVPPVLIDPSPDPTKDEYYIYICETLQAGDEVMTFIGYDQDGDMNMTFSMDASDNETREFFEIVGDKLLIKSSVSVDAFDIDKADAVMNFSIELSVSDGILSSILSTFIIIEDDNDNAPEFSGDNTSYILETAAAGTSVLQVTAVDNDRTTENNQVTLTLTGAPEFELNGDIIQVAAGANFDVTTQNEYILTVTASDDVVNDTQSTDREVFIYIRSKPQFGKLNTSQITSVFEDADENTAIFVLDVTDRDNSGPLNITVIKSEEMFEVNGNTLNLKQGKSLDAEGNQTSYEVQFNASDGIYEVTSEVLTFSVDDVNDNTPEFTETDKTIEISETVPNGTVVYTVSARDGDVSDPTLIYSITEFGGEHFSIDESTGEISTITSLEFTDKNEFNLVLTVKDGLGPSDRSATTVLTIELATAPLIINPADQSTWHILENTPVGETFTQIILSDPDDDEPKYELSQVPEMKPMKFELQGNNIVTNDTFDVDAVGAEKAYTLELKVSDGRDYTVNHTITFTVNIDDSNDSPPTFSQDSFETDVMETEAVGNTVLTVTATDIDADEPNNLISYSLSGSPNFRVDPDSGDIIVDASLEYDTQQQHDLIVMATDKGFPEKSASTSVTLTILAEPSFDNLAETININENLPASTIVFNVTVSDSDKTWDGEVLISSQTPGDMFQVEGTMVKTKTNGLDAESKQLYTLTFNVSDGPFTVESEPLTINIIDLNDNPPVITDVAPITIDENKDLGSSVVVIQANDNDVTASNNELDYSIISGNDNDTFTIDVASGNITLENAPLSEQYNLTIKVSDNGTPVETAVTVVTINVNHIPIDECSGDPCLNDATCTPGVNSYTCSCVPGWIGTNCETNKNECIPEPCENEGTCTDLINDYTCNCTKGWEGKNCTIECTNNTHGRNCEGTCNCDVARLVDDVENQQCDRMTGRCKCNAKWIGATCETDVDECEDTSLCTEVPRLICENTIGDYYCTCEHGYIDISGTCVTDARAIVITVGEGEVSVLLNMSINATCPDLRKPSVYNETKDKLEFMLNRDLPSKKRLVVTSITCGSLNFQTTVVIDESDAANLANELSNIKDTIEYDGNPVTVQSVEVNDNPLDTSAANPVSALVCEAYTSISACGRDETCTYQNGMASCKLVESDNTGLILALGLGLCLPLLAMLVMAALCFYCYKRKQLHERQTSREHNKGWRKEYSPWHGRLKTNGVKLDTRHYNRNNYYDNANFNGSYLDNRRYLDVPAVGYTTI